MLLNDVSSTSHFQILILSPTCDCIHIASHWHCLRLMASPSTDARLHYHRHRQTRRRVAHTASPPTTNPTPLDPSGLQHSIPLSQAITTLRAASLTMPTPLIGVDANPRQPGFRPTKLESKIPSPPKFQRTGSTDRHSAFSVSGTVSPCYNAMPIDAQAVVMPRLTSKLPRKSAATQSVFSRSHSSGSGSETPRESLSQFCNWQKPATAVVPLGSVRLLFKNNTVTADFQQVLVRTIPPLSCDKPLPSPPIAQLTSPSSPPKAQRTLVDAEAGTPTEEDWPVLHPENLPSPKFPIPSIGSSLTQRSVSEGPSSQRNRIPMPKSRLGSPSQISDSLIEGEEATNQRSRQIPLPRRFGSMNPYVKPFHAFSTDSYIATDIPLPHKQQNLPAVAIPPRISSKRPSPDITADELPTRSSASIPAARLGCTKWPILAVTDKTAQTQETDEACENEHCYTPVPEHNELILIGGANGTQSNYGSFDSISTRSLAAGSSLGEEAEIKHEGSIRVKHLSCHSSNTESGPILRISADADAVLLGRRHSIPAVPALPEDVPKLKKHPTDSFPGRVSKQALVNMDASAGSGTSMPCSTETETTEGRSIKITPIRSMQPPRTPSMGDLPQKSPSLGTVASVEVEAVDRSSTNSTVDCTTMQPESNTPSLTLGERPRSNYVCHVEVVCVDEANMSNRKPAAIQQHYKTGLHKEACRYWAPMQMSRSR